MRGGPPAPLCMNPEQLALLREERRRLEESEHEREPATAHPSVAPTLRFSSARRVERVEAFEGGILAVRVGK